MEKEKQNNQSKSPKYSYTTISDYFLDEWTEVLGTGPSMLYIHLLKYCHKGKDIAWPTLKTLSKRMGVAENTLIRYRKILVKYGFIRNIFKKESTSRNNIYQVTLGQDLADLKILSYMVTNCNDTSKMSSSMVTKCKVDGYKMSSSMVTKCNPNNNNLNNNNITTTNGKEDAAVTAVDFKKSKEEGGEKMQALYSSKEHYTGQAIKEQLMNLDFEESFIEKLLKDYSAKKIEEKLELLKFKKNIQNPAGWLRAALKNDYQGLEQESHDEEPVGQVSNLSGKSQKIFSRKVALKGIRLIRENLSLISTKNQ